MMLDNDNACRAVFSKWIEKDGNPTHYPLAWQGLYDLLCNIGHRRIATEVAAAKQEYVLKEKN